MSRYDPAEIVIGTDAMEYGYIPPVWLGSHYSAFGNDKRWVHIYWDNSWDHDNFQGIHEQIRAMDRGWA